LVTRRQLLELGFGSRSIEHRLMRGRLHRVAAGVYAVGWPGMSRKRRWMTAVLGAGDAAVLSHHSAAALWGFGRELPGWVDVSVPRNASSRRRGVRTRRRLNLRPKDVTRREEIPVTGLIQTFLDIATELPLNRLERAVNEADKRDLIDPDALRRALDSRPGAPGIRSLRDVLDQHTFRLSDDELEVLFRPLARAAGVPVQLTKQRVNEFEVDFYWPDLRLVVETDGWRYHRTPAAQTRAALRDQVHTASGLTPLRFSHYQVKYEPAHVKNILTKTVARLRPA
jgi:very-short-patch-repair endonuclease